MGNRAAMFTALITTGARPFVRANFISQESDSAAISSKDGWGQLGGPGSVLAATLTRSAFNAWWSDTLHTHTHTRTYRCFYTGALSARFWVLGKAELLELGMSTKVGH